MKYITSALVIVALFNSQATTNAIQLSAEFSDDLVKDIALEMSHEVETGEVQAETTEDPPKKDETKDEIWNNIETNPIGMREYPQSVLEKFDIEYEDNSLKKLKSNLINKYKNRVYFI